MQHVATDIHS